MQYYKKLIIIAYSIGRQPEITYIFGSFFQLCNLFPPVYFIPQGVLIHIQLLIALYEWVCFLKADSNSLAQ